MSISKIRAALEERLAAMPPALPTAFENVKFVPQAGVPYQRCFLLPANPDDGEQGPRNFIELGIFQVSLYYPTNAGPADAQARAELVRQQFKRATTMVKDDTSVIVISTPRIAPAFTDVDRYVIPISVSWQSHATT